MGIDINPENTSQNFILEDIPYTPIPADTQDISDYISIVFFDITQTLGWNYQSFWNFLEISLQKNNLGEQDINGFEFKNSILSISLQNGENISIPIEEYSSYLVQQILWNTSLEDQEEKVKSLQDAIEQIYQDNSGIFSGEINDEDVVRTGDYHGKTLLELREILDTEQAKLYAIYNINTQTQKKEELLKREIEFFAWVGDIYEWWARYFSLSSWEINNKVRRLTQDMSVEDIFQYIIDINQQIDDNWRKSDMVTQINAKLLRSLYENCFSKLKSENRPNTDFIRFVKIITGREIESFDHSNKEIYLDIDVDASLIQYDIVNSVLLYVMDRPDGIMDTLIASQEWFSFWDPEIENRKPQEIVSHALASFNSLAAERENYGEEICKEAWFESLLEFSGEYNDLSFDQKIQLSSLYKISQKIDSSWSEWLQNPEGIMNFILKETQESFDIIKADFDDAFDGYNLNLWIAHPNFFGTSSEDIGLEWEFAEIFDIYQDINGNGGFFDLHDETFHNIANISTIAVLWAGIIAWAIIFSWVSVAAIPLLIAWAEVGAITWVTSLLTSRQWYDTYEEAIWDSGKQFTLEVASSALFTFGVGKWLQLAWKQFLDVDLLFSKEAWSASGFIDKWFMAGEVWSGIVLNGITDSERKEQFPENHFDTDQTSYHERMRSE